MKIIDVHAFPIEFPLDTPAQDATGVWDSWNTVIVKITAEDGTSDTAKLARFMGAAFPFSRRWWIIN